MNGILRYTDVAILRSVTGGLVGDSGDAYFHLWHLLGYPSRHIVCRQARGRVWRMLFEWSISAVYAFVVTDEVDL